ncbi:MAG: polysaccharide biosynthesis protein [Culicoidibacterales bacterium]
MKKILVDTETKMVQILRLHREIALFIIDSLVVSLAYFLGFFFMFHMLFLRDRTMLVDLLIILPIIVIIYALSILKFSLHESLWKYFGINEIQTILYVNFVSFFITSCVALPLSIFTPLFHNIPTFTLVMTFILSSFFSVLGMFSIRFVYRMYREKKMNFISKSKKSIIIGAGGAGYLMLKDLLHTENVSVVGFVDDKLAGKTVAGVKVLGGISDLEEITKKNNIDFAYLAIPSVNMTRQKEILGILSDLDVNVKIMHKKRHDDHRIGSKFKYPINDVSIEDLLGRGEIKLDSQEITSYLKNQVVMVTGAGGSIGSELCRQILKFTPKQLIMADINENALYMLERELKMEKELSTEIFSFITSIRDIEALDEIMKTYQPDVVFHAAAHKHVPLMETRPQEAIKNNVVGTRNVIDTAIKNKVSRFVLISTDKAVNPTNVMGATKRITELILQSRANNGVTKLGAVRFGNVLGSNGSVIPIFKEQIKNGGPVTLTHRDVIRYFMTIPEAAQLVLQAGFYAHKGEIFVLDMGEPVKIYDLARKMIQLSGYKPEVDIEIKEVGLRPGEKMFEELNLGSETVDKTKHDLIFETHSKEIDVQLLEQQIQQLEQLSTSNETATALKQQIFDVIQKWN